MSLRRPSNPGLWQSAVLFGVAYFLCAKLGRLLSVPAFPYATFWLPAGLYVGVLLLNKTRSWPWFILAAAAGNLLFDLPKGTPLGTTLGYYSANTGEAVVGAWLVRRFVAEKPELASLREFFGLVVGAALLSTMLGAAIGSATLIASGMSHSFWGSWITWWGDEALAVFVLTPFILVWFGQPDQVEKWGPRRGKLVEATLLAALLVAGIWYLLVLDQGINSPYKSRLMPLLLWAGLRFGMRGVTAANLLLALLMAYFTTNFLVGLTPAQIASGSYIGTLQSFLLISILISLMPTVVIHERNRKVAALSESDERFRQLSDNLPDSMVYKVVRETDGTMKFLHLSAGIERLNGLSAAAVQRDSALFYHQILEADRPIMVAAREASVKSMCVFNVNVRMRRADGAIRWINLNSAPRPLPDGRTVWDGIETDITERKLAETALQQSEERFARMFKSSPMPVSLIRLADGVILDANESFFRMCGYAREEVIGRTALELNAYPDPGDRAFIMEQLHEHGHLHGHEQLFRTKSGQIRNHQLWFEVIPIGGEPCMLVLGLDITEHKRAEEKLKSSEEQYRGLFEHMLGGFLLMEVVCDGAGRPVDHRLLQANSGFERMTGLKRSEELGRTSADLSFKWPAEVVQRYYQVALGGEPLHWERFNESLHRFYDTRVFSPQPGQFAMVFYDITDRKRVEESHDRLATAVEQASEIIVITDTRGTMLYVNPSFVKITGYTFAEAVGQNPRILKSGNQDPAFYRQMWDTLRRGEVWCGHFINRRKDGTLYEEEATITPVRDDSGKIVNYVAVKRDVTREAQLEAQFRQAQKMEAVGQLAGGVAHDFNNILAVIQLQAGLLKSEPALSDFQRDSATEIEKASQRAADLTRQLLLFSRKQALQLRDLNLNDVLTNVTRMLQRTLGEQVQMEVKYARQPLLIHADAGMMEQILMNLTINARDAMPAGGRLIIETAAVDFDAATATETAQARPGSFACVSVTDTGCGIPPEIISKIFEPFFTTKEVGKGTGLGLATVFGIIQQHQGWINVYSEVGHGTTFRYYLPRLVQPADPKIAGAAPSAARGGNETILLVEDDASVRLTIQKALLHLGYRVLEASNGAEALAVWKQHRDEIRLLLTDMMMPGGMTGRELAANLLEQEPKLKVIYASGYSAEIGGPDFPLEEGVNYLAKPFVAHQLAQTVRNCLDKV